MTRTITIKISTNKAGKPVAHYYGAAKRWLPISVAVAEVALSTGKLFNSNAVAYEDNNA